MGRWRLAGSFDAAVNRRLAARKDLFPAGAGEVGTLHGGIRTGLVAVRRTLAFVGSDIEQGRVVFIDQVALRIGVDGGDILLPRDDIVEQVCLPGTPLAFMSIPADDGWNS